MHNYLGNITEQTPFELLDNGSARLYWEQGIVESVFYGFQLICQKYGVLYTYINEREDIRHEAIKIMMKKVGIEDYYLKEAKLMYNDNSAVDKILIIKFNNNADEAFFRLNYINAFHEYDEGRLRFIVEN